jgi:long-chain acyl-CoA synthetase
VTPAVDADWQNITDPVFHWAAQRPHAPAIVQHPETLSYGDLAPLIGKAAVYLDSIGIRQGDRIAINLTNSIDHFVLTLALLRLGATTIEMPYNTRAAPSFDVLTRFGVRTLFIEPDGAPVAGIRSIKIDAGWRGAIALARGDRRSSDDGKGIFAIMLTSGTTGRPKGSVISHREFFRRAHAYTELLAGADVFAGETPAKFLLAASIGFGSFIQRTIAQFVGGGAVVILPEFLHAIDLIKAIGAWGDAYCYVPAAVCGLLISSAPASGFLYPRLRALVAGAGFLHPQEKLAMLARVCPNFYHSYGASGIGSIAVLGPNEMRARADSVGRPPSSVEVQVVDEYDRPLPPGATGQLRCRSSEAGGFAAEDDHGSDERFRDGWYYPGDRARIDQAGYIFLQGRASDAIRRGGSEVFPGEIEAAIAEHFSVAEVAVVGVPGPLRDDEIVALVVPRGRAEHEALAAHCRSRLHPERRPNRVFYADALPKTAAGKLDRVRVRALVMQQTRRQAGG